MSNYFTEIQFDRNTGATLDFDVFPLESMLSDADMEHDPKSLRTAHFYVMIIVTGGNGEHTIDFKQYEYQRGSVLTIRKDQVHSFNKGQAQGFLILFTEEYVLRFLDQAGVNKIVGFFNEQLFDQHTEIDELAFNEITKLIQHILKEFNQSIDEHSSGIIRNYLQILISKIYRIRDQSATNSAENKYTPIFTELQELVETHCASERNVQYYADQLHVTTRTLSNVTHAMVNKSTKTFIDDIAIIKIKRLLINTSLSVKEIAYKSGFDEPSNLFKFFKKYVGKTPESFRDSFK